MALQKQSKLGLAKARIAAARWHNDQKATRLAEIVRSAEITLNSYDITNDVLSELALAFLYLGEGAKTNNRTALGSSDIRIARFFVHCLQNIYDVPPEKIKCYLHLRADQDLIKTRDYWSKGLGLPYSNFGKTSIDKRTVGKPTYPHYKGVCLIVCGRVDIQRRLMYIANGFCEKFTDS